MKTHVVHELTFCKDAPTEEAAAEFLAKEIAPKVAGMNFIQDLERHKIRIAIIISEVEDFDKTDPPRQLRQRQKPATSSPLPAESPQEGQAQVLSLAPRLIAQGKKRLSDSQRLGI